MLFFMHIPKTAGTSLRAQIARWCEPGAMEISYANELCPLNPDSHFLHSVKQRRSRVKILFGHFGWGAHELLDQPANSYATVLRDPIERAVSFFAHVAREPRSRHYRAIQNGMTLKDLVLSHRAPELNNHYVRMLLGSRCWTLSLWPPDPSSPARPIDQLLNEHRLEEAWERMRSSFCHVGRTERYADSLAALARIVGGGGAISGEVERLNVKPPDAPRVDLDASTESVLRQYNALDIKLYHRVTGQWG